jgi:hypothetical protein
MEITPQINNIGKNGITINNKNENQYNPFSMYEGIIFSVTIVRHNSINKS